MSTIINGTSSAITFPDSSVQNTSAIVSGYVPYANLPAGSVLQVIGATTTSTTSTTSTSFVTTSLTASITPKFSTSKVLILINGGMMNFDNSGSQIRTTIYRNSTNLGSSSFGMAEYYVQSGGQVQMPTSMSYLDSPATTSSTAYTMYIRSGGGQSIQFNADAVTTSITLLEIAA
jgi:hypothetical protein